MHWVISLEMFVIRKTWWHQLKLQTLPSKTLGSLVAINCVKVNCGEVQVSMQKKHHHSSLFLLCEFIYPLFLFYPLSSCGRHHRVPLLPLTVSTSLISPLCLMSVPVPSCSARQKQDTFPTVSMCMSIFKCLCFPVCGMVTMGDGEQWSWLRSGHALVVYVPLHVCRC